MYREISLAPLGAADSQLIFDWDPESGDIKGISADLVRAELDYAISEGFVISHPRPTRYEISDPYHNAAELAAVLSCFWVLDDDLRGEFKKIARQDESQEDPPDCITLY